MHALPRMGQGTSRIRLYSSYHMYITMQGKEVRHAAAVASSYDPTTRHQSGMEITEGDLGRRLNNRKRSVPSTQRKGRVGATGPLSSVQPDVMVPGK